ncbi:MAG: FAD-dependent oxidoreductase [Thermoplasmata archaeon]|nr:FAD-dependent oxidoreductase [Thermoplasmata archaeon]
MGDDFDAIVVGAGMAGSSAAIRLAKGGANVLLLERGAEPGAKNLSGGILWGHDLDAILPNWWETMPVERHVVRKRFGFLTPEGAVSFQLSDGSWAKPPYVAHSVLRARTDKWLAAQAEAAGATVVASVPVEKLNWEGTRVHGIVQGGETMTAPVTILADGANSRLALGTPIRPNPRLSGEATELGIKEVYRLPKATIEDRFNVRDGEGHAEEWVAGIFPPGVLGGGFLYTNRDTVSLGIILNIASMFGKDVRSHDLLERFKLHPEIAGRLDGAELVEYGAKLISSGWASRPAAFHGDGWMVAGDAAGFVYSNGLVIQGMNYAVRTGLLAAETALESKAAHDPSAARLAAYHARLEATHVLSDFREFEALDQVKWNPRFYREYPDLAYRVLHDLMTETGAPKEHARALAWKAFRKSKVKWSTAAKDVLSLGRNL